MKVKKLSKKLVLSKATISNLNPGQMESANGGIVSKFQCSVYMTNCQTECGGVYCDDTLSDCTYCTAC